MRLTHSRPTLSYASAQATHLLSTAHENVARVISAIRSQAEPADLAVIGTRASQESKGRAQAYGLVRWIVRRDYAPRMITTRQLREAF